MTNEPRSQWTLFYDAQCDLCDRAVRWTMLREPSATLRVAPLQGTTAAQHLGRQGVDPTGGTAVLLAPDGTRYRRSDAVCRVLGLLGGPWAWIGRAGRCVPRPIRDGVYRVVAKRRRALVGTQRMCAALPPEIRARFLE